MAAFVGFKENGPWCLGLLLLLGLGMPVPHTSVAGFVSFSASVTKKTKTKQQQQQQQTLWPSKYTVVSESQLVSNWAESVTAKGGNVVSNQPCWEETENLVFLT